ncbi:Rap1a/Tai family immunity protein [Pyruvatibacter mobilis]|uniref:Rap1a/Tai family immunity protein n=1 Tax=Pyruvatibacter mobilis TaxID=1712261 RepID=UPI003C7E3625
MGSALNTGLNVRHIRLLTVTGAVMLCLAVLAGPTGAGAKGRVETGRDLYVACEKAVRDFEAGKTPQTSLAIHHCNRFLAGLFRSHQTMTRNRLTAKQHGLDETDHVQCLRVPRSATFKQLAEQVVRQAEWQPHLLDGSAVNLAFTAFDAMTPC